MKFESLFQIERYTEEACQISGRMNPRYFQIQFISVLLSIYQLVIIRSCQKSNFRQIKRQQRQAPKKNLNNNNNNSKNRKYQNGKNVCTLSRFTKTQRK